MEPNRTSTPILGFKHLKNRFPALTPIPPSSAERASHIMDRTVDSNDSIVDDSLAELNDAAAGKENNGNQTRERSLIETKEMPPKLDDTVETLSSSSEDGDDDGSESEKETIPFTAEEKNSVKNLSKEAVEEQLRTLKRIDLKSAPDNGRKVKRRMALLEDRLKAPFKVEVLEAKRDLKTKMKEDADAYLGGDKRLFGGKITEGRAEKIDAVNEEVAKHLHHSLDKAPVNVVTETPAGLKTDLMIHQKHGLTWLKYREQRDQQTCRGGILADDMGLGKTLSMVALILEQKNARKENPQIKDELVNDMKRKFRGDDDIYPCFSTLVVAPASVIYQWEQEIKNRVQKGKLKVTVFHGPKRETDPAILGRNDIVITTYAIISSELGEAKKLVGHETDDDDDSNDDDDGYFMKKKAPGGKKKISKNKNKSVLTQIGWERIILDEAHNIKNRRSLTSKGCCSLVALKRWALTGTPIHNELWDFYSLVKFLHIKPFEEEKYWKDYMSQQSKNGTERLNTLVKAILLRRTKDQTCSVTNKPLVDLKPKNYEIVEVALEGVEQKCYQQMFAVSQKKAAEVIRNQDMESGLHRRRIKNLNVVKNPFIGGPKEVDLVDDKFQAMSCLLVLLLRLRQACVHMALTRNAVDLDAFKEDGGEFNDAMDELEKTFGNISLAAISNEDKESKEIHAIFEPAFVSAKMKILLEKMEKVIESGDKIVLVSQWTSMLDIVESHLQKKKIRMTSITGKVLTKDRQERIDSFNKKIGGAQVMLLSLTAGGVGLNLVGGNHLFLLDLHWNPALEQQACDRIYRMGQQKDVYIHKIVCKDTIEQRVLELQNSKSELAKGLLEGAAKKMNKLSINDIMHLFDLNKPSQAPKPKETYRGPANVRMRE